jgi:BirA family biotin operon repressor/biotin-[acetyl-CoA-carboxylase] ligase
MQRKLMNLLADGQQHSGSDLAAALHVSRAAVWKQVNQLRELGVDVRAQRGQGYSLPAAVELLDSQQIIAAVPPQFCAIIDELQVHWVTNSTCDYLLHSGRTEPGRARVCLAEYQTGGRGRRGRRWFAAVGTGLCISVGWCFPAAPASLSCLGLAVGVGVLRAVRNCGASGAQLKWPNDLVVAGKKLAGILVDVQGEAGGPLQVVAGVGLNFLPDPRSAKEIIDTGGLVPMSLAEVTTGCPDRNKVAAELTAALISVLQQFEHSGFKPLEDEWLAADYLRGKIVEVVTGANKKVGIASGISNDGQLLVNIDGSLQQLVTGDVSVRAVP